MQAVCRSKFKSLYDIHEHVGGEDYIPLPAYNDIYGIIALYSVSKFSTFLILTYTIASMHTCMPSPPLFWRVYQALANTKSYR